MQTRSIFIGAGVLVVLLLAGCQSITDQIGKKVAEGVIGQAIGGDVKIDEKSGNIAIKTKDGEANIGGGSTRPASVPAELPNLPGAQDFTWLGNSEGGVLGFKLVATADFKADCVKLQDLMKQAGWEESKDALTLDADDMATKVFTKTGKVASVSCSKDGADAQFIVSSGKDSSVKSNAVEENIEPTAVETVETAPTEAAPVE
jgi:hypothetical protein